MGERCRVHQVIDRVCSIEAVVQDQGIDPQALDRAVDQVGQGDRAEDQTHDLVHVNCVGHYYHVDLTWDRVDPGGHLKSGNGGNICETCLPIKHR